MKRSRKLMMLGIFVLGMWSAFVMFLYDHSMESHRDSIRQMALVSARATFEKDCTYRRWVSRLGGFYVPISERVPPNPYLKIAHRDMTTTNGTRMTLVNPAYMSRMVYEIMEEKAGPRAHITSLDPLNPVNAPSPWERKALQSFQEGELEAHEIGVLGGEPVLHFMSAMLTETHCLKCHAAQGYTLGSVRGGISVTVPMAQYDSALEALESHARSRYGLIWASGFGFIGFGFLSLVREERSRQNAEQEQRQASIRLEESEAFLKSLYDNSPMSIFVLDVDHDGSLSYVGVNAACARLSGLPESMAQEDVCVLFPSKTAEVMHTLFTECIRTRRTMELEHQVRHADEEAWWLLRVTPLVDEGGRVWRLVGNAMPITSWKQAEEALRAAKDQAEMASQSKSDFLANMSHEIRTPLNGVVGMMQLIQQTELSEEQTEYVDMALASSRRLTRLLSDILDLSRIEAGRMILHETRFSLHDIRDTVLDLFRLSASDGRIDLRFDIAEGTARDLLGDDARLLQILFNLVGNAIKFTPENGSVHVSVSELPHRKDARRLLFIIRDTGIGIPEVRLGELFEPFTQVESSYTRRFQGAGLGLAIVRRLVTLLEGSMTFDSVENEGTTIYLALPFKAADQETTAPAVSETPSEKTWSDRLLLLVEDDDANRMAGRRILEKCGYSVETARDGQEAVNMVRQTDYDLILMDIQMPVMDGVEACRAIRGMPGSKSRIPIIAMTAYAQSGDKEVFLDAGMQAYLSKPVEMATLEATVARVIDSPCGVNTAL